MVPVGGEHVSNVYVAVVDGTNVYHTLRERLFVQLGAAGSPVVVAAVMSVTSAAV